MKKIFSFLAIAMLVMLPMTTNAAGKIVQENGQIPCTPDPLDSTKMNCTVSLEVTGENEKSVTIDITEHNATVDTNSIEAGPTWNVDNSTYPKLVFTSTDEAGNAGTTVLFTFTYTKATNGEECYVSINGSRTETTSKDTDTPVENEQTGVTLPYIFLGAALLIAGYAFVATKNKSKMFKI